MNENLLSQVVATISLAIAIVLIILIFSYSYLLIETFSEKAVLTKELIKTRLELEAERESRGLVQQDKEQLTHQVQFLRTQLQQQKQSKPCPVCCATTADSSTTSLCQASNQNTNMNLIHKALRQTLSAQANDRFEGFFTLMNNIDYLTDQQQRELIEFYLQQMKPTNQEGVYYAVFIMSQLQPARLQEYEAEIEEKYRFIYFQPGWERISYRYCQIESKLTNYFQ
jgi:hypothetical protein